LKKKDKKDKKKDKESESKKKAQVVKQESEDHMGVFGMVKDLFDSKTRI